jgi:2,5-dichloro-2,5-cyclohexadiene-1,4-diol dehydrogenase 1
MSAYEKLAMSGKVVTVTGGGSGIGAACARLLAERGASVVVADIDDAKGEAVASQARQGGGKAAFLHVDVTEA